jgi:hypothetical protein
VTLQVPAELPVTAVSLIRRGPRRGHVRVEGAGEHPPGQNKLGGELDVSRDTRGGAPIRVVGPRLGQVDLPVDQRVATRRGIGEVDRDLRVLHPPGGPGVLPLHTDGVHTLLQVTGVVQDEDPTRVAKRIDHVPPHVVTHLVGVPHRLAQQSLHRMRRRVPGPLSQLPTRTIVYIRQQPEQERPGPPPWLHPPEAARDPREPCAVP